MERNELLLSKLTALQPVAAGLTRMGLDPDLIFSRYFPATDAADAADAAKIEIPSIAIYQMVENIARDTGDQFFGCRLADPIGPELSSYFGLLASENTTVSEMLIQLQLAQRKMHAPVPLEISVATDGASVTLKRNSIAPEATIQVDAWSVTATCNALSKKIGHNWDPQKIRILLPDRNSLLPEVAPSSSIESWQYSGFKLTFPAEWLLLKSDTDAAQSEEAHSTSPNDFVGQIKAVLRPICGDPQLTLNKAAQYCGQPPRQLQSTLADNGTTFSEVMAGLKREFAEEQLAGGLMGITGISEALGYSDVSAFSRAFKGWTGLSPDNFRKQHRS